MTKHEEEVYRKLAAKKRAEQRAEKAFWVEVDKRRDEVREHVLEDIAKDYDATPAELIQWIQSDRQVEYGRRNIPHEHSLDIFAELQKK